MGRREPDHVEKLWLDGVAPAWPPGPCFRLAGPIPAGRPRRQIDSALLYSGSPWESSKIAEPPVAFARLQTRKPKTQRIEQCDYGKPYRVYDPERVAVVRRVEVRRAAQRWDWIQQEACLAVSKKSEWNGKSMNDEDMDKEVEKRPPAEHHQRVGLRQREAVEPCHQQQGGTKGHEQEIERRRIFGAPQKRQDGHARYLSGPANRISIDVDSADDEKREGHAQADASHPPAAPWRVEWEDWSEAEAGGHHGNPWHQRVGGQDAHPAPLGHAGLVEKGPPPTPLTAP